MAKKMHLFTKRAIDIIGASVALFILSPVLLITALLVARKFGHPILFSQKRAGLHGNPFTIYKFRTMTDEKDTEGNLLSEQIRLTPFGKKLRSSSIDELPELWNVLRNDMSLVGPRPLHIRYISRYSPVQARRLDVKPGITGWAQVNGRNALSWDEKFQLDVWYVENASIMLDLKILFLTVRKVFKREGISPEGKDTPSEFMGSFHDSKKENSRQ